MSFGNAAIPHDERTARAHELLLEQLRSLTSSDQWLAMLEMSRRFHSYSARNVLLLIAQGAQGHVAGYRTWQTIPADGGGTCQVRKGATALTILAPVTRTVERRDDTTGESTTRRALAGFKAVRVFDEAALVNGPAANDVLPELLAGDSPQAIYDALASQVHAANVQLQVGDCAPANGRTHWTTRTVTIRADLEPAQRTKTLAHELAHVRLHDPKPAREAEMSRDRMEVEAESVAYLVCAHAGLDSTTYTIPYVAHWSAGNLELVRDTAERVIDTARTITGSLDQALQPGTGPNVEVTPPVAFALTTHPPHNGAEDDVRTRRLHPSSTPTPHRLNDETDLAAIARHVDADAAALLRRLAADPDAWGADPEDRAALQRAAARTAPAHVATARARLAELIHHPASPEPPDLTDTAPAPTPTPD